MKFLIVDDSAVDRRLLSSCLQKMNHETEECNNTEGLLELIAQNNYDAVFLDIVMPKMDGYKFLRSLRAKEETKEQYVVFCSSKKTKIEINYGKKKAGANDYLVKPVTQEHLQKIIDNM